ncbi:MAG: radical SAM protein [Candidatus Omnitrophota bacterium]|nr:radical SAM protein [Candidatus Omnitrophota bacterium]
MKVLQNFKAVMQGRIKKAYKLMEKCCICPRKCGVNRLKGQIGFCKAGLLPMVSSFHAHFGEEPPISGRSGSGTIFFTHCSLRCVFCQNHPISQLGSGKEVSVEELAGMMLKLQAEGCHNINFVTPAHYMPQILKAVFIAKELGLNIPLVYNSGGYESIEALEILDGIIDIYMPDMKYSDSSSAKKYSNAPDYFEINKIAVKEMYRQVGDLKMDRGIAKKGLLIRHLVLPEDLAGSQEVFEFIANELSPDTYVNVMAQYYSGYLADKYPEIDRRITAREYMEAIRLAEKAGLKNGFRQVMSTIMRKRIPEWTDNLKGL